jgi:hypothetical protein
LPLVKKIRSVHNHFSGGFVYELYTYAGFPIKKGFYFLVPQRNRKKTFSSPTGIEPMLSG